ncbi:hypothetical protein CPZ06_10175 [Lactobacillus acidophilus]|nr:hypothetical protein CPZ06_10175 [Lactobacillus acidophilus]
MANPSLRCALGMRDADGFDVVRAPDDAVAAHATEEEGLEPERRLADLGLRDDEAAIHHVVHAVLRLADDDGAMRIGEEDEHVAVAHEERGRVRGDRVEGVVHHGRP